MTNKTVDNYVIICHSAICFIDFMFQLFLYVLLVSVTYNQISRFRSRLNVLCAKILISEVTCN